MTTQQTSIPLIVRAGEEPLLSLDMTSRGTGTAITIGVEPDMSTTRPLVDLAKLLSRARPDQVVLDLAAVTFLCAAGLRALLQARDTLAAVGARLVLRALSSPTRRILTISGADFLPVDSITAPAAEGGG